jgi:hypothetical protein
MACLKTLSQYLFEMAEECHIFCQDGRIRPRINQRLGYDAGVPIIPGYVNMEGLIGSV